MLTTAKLNAAGTITLNMLSTSMEELDIIL
jgi:hypothetical protein